MSRVMSAARLLAAVVLVFPAHVRSAPTPGQPATSPDSTGTLVVISRFAISGRPVRFGTVEIAHSRTRASSDSGGVAVLNDVPAGTPLVVRSLALGLETQAALAFAHSGRRDTVLLELEEQDSRRIVIDEARTKRKESSLWFGLARVKVHAIDKLTGLTVPVLEVRETHYGEHVRGQGERGVEMRDVAAGVDTLVIRVPGDSVAIYPLSIDGGKLIDI